MPGSARIKPLGPVGEMICRTKFFDAAGQEFAGLVATQRRRTRRHRASAPLASVSDSGYRELEDALPSTRIGEQKRWESE